MIVAPSILEAVFSRLLEEVQDVEKHGAQFLHIDVMDGHFVPNITLGPMVFQNLKPHVGLVFDVHLMISDPYFYAKAFAEAGADYLTFHYETVEDPAELIAHYQSLNVKPGISIKPATDVRVLDSLLPELDLVLIMSVEPGFGGQSFMPQALEKIAYLREKKEKENFGFLIEVDGGINAETGRLCKEAGADVLVAGTHIFKAADRRAVIRELLEL